MPQAASVPLKKSALWGALAGLAVWLPIPVLDCIDEFLLHVSPVLPVPVFLMTPVVMTALYVKQHRAGTARRRNFAVWLLCYTVTFMLAWIGISKEIAYLDVAVFVPQGQNSENYSLLNTAEYIWFGIPALFVFLFNVFVYHFVNFMKRGLARVKDDSL